MFIIIKGDMKPHCLTNLCTQAMLVVLKYIVTELSLGLVFSFEKNVF